MTWTKLGDEFTDECWTLTDAAFRLHVEGLVWSNRKGTDGQLAKDEMRRWARHPEAAEELVAIGWWVDRGQHYEIIHHIGYQRTRAQLAHQSITNRAAANARWSKKKRDKSSNDSHNDSHNDSQCKQDRTGQDRPGQEGDSTKKTTTATTATRGATPTPTGLMKSPRCTRTICPTRSARTMRPRPTASSATDTSHERRRQVRSRSYGRLTV